MRKLKKIALAIFSVLAISMAVLGISACGDDQSAENAQVGTEGLEYTLSSDGTYYSVTRYNGTATEVIIPATYQGKPVTSIGESAFYNCDSLTIYCEWESKPSGWDSYWNPNNRPVVWGYKE